MSNLIVQDDNKYLINLNKKKPTTPPVPLISKFISKTRIMPPGTPIPGIVDLSVTPYAIEWMDNMSPYSTVQHQALLKAAQVAATWSAENIIGYWMKELPTAIMVLSATDALLEKWSTKRLEPMIDSMGIREKIIEYAEGSFNKKSRKTGDKTFQKLFIGGFLEMASAQSPASQRSDSIRLMVRDEIDGAPKYLTTGEGNWLDTSYARTKFWGQRKKIFDMSTPTLLGESNIWEAYEIGDKRHYMVHCPMCNKPQFLYYLPETGNHGLRGDYKAGKLDKVYYLCEHCHDAIFDTSKYDMFVGGHWEPTAESSSDEYRSYYINSLYSPTGTVSFKDYYNQWKESVNDPEKMQTFTNLYGGLPYREMGARRKVENVIELRGDYKSNEVPDGVLYLTAAVDVQRGERNNPNKPARVEMEVLGHGAGYRTWSICYEVFEGAIDNIDSGAWKALADYARKTGLRYYRDDNFQFDVKRIFIDCGDPGKERDYLNVVYDFCNAWKNTYPSKGFGWLKKRKAEEGDKMTTGDYRRYRFAQVGGGQSIYEISTNYYKKRLYRNLGIERIDAPLQMAGYCSFPRDYGEEYFKQLTAEELRLDGSFHDGGRAHESLDIRVYNLCAGDVYLEDFTKILQAEALNRGAKKQEIVKIDHKFALTVLEKRTVKRRIGGVEAAGAAMDAMKKK
jgi:phage terminase large subunit GpA-like protein